MAKAIRKERFVTRTISSSVVSVNCYNRTEKKEEVITKRIPEKLDAFADEMYILDAFDSDRYRSLNIISVIVEEKKYKISEADFVKYGKPLTKEEEAAEAKAEAKDESDEVEAKA